MNRQAEPKAECHHEDHETRLLIDESCAKWCKTCGAFRESMDDAWRLPQSEPTQLHCDCDKCTAARLHHYAVNRQAEPGAECEWCKGGWLPKTAGYHNLPNGQSVKCAAENRE